MTREEIEELKGLAASMGLYDDKKPCKRAVILGKAIKALEQESSGDLISRQAVLECFTWTNDKADIWNRIKELPPVNPQPKTGHWIEVDTNEYVCSNCGHSFSIVPEDNSIKEYKCCPNCGAKMVEPQESEE